MSDHVARPRSDTGLRPDPRRDPSSRRPRRHGRSTDADPAPARRGRVGVIVILAALALAVAALPSTPPLATAQGETSGTSWWPGTPALAAPTGARGHVGASVIRVGSQDVARLTWGATAAPGNTRLVDFEVYTGQTPDAGPWSFYQAVTPQADGSGTLDIPSAKAALGRYYHVVAVYSDGTRVDGYDTGVGPARYVSLGDSFSAGEGVPPFEPGTASDLDGVSKKSPGYNTCHRSATGSYPRVLTGDPGIGVNLAPATFAACSGSRTVDVTGPGSTYPEPAQDRAVNQFTDLVTLTLGGNDAGFSTIAAVCAVLDCTSYIRQNQAKASGRWSWLHEIADESVSDLTPAGVVNLGWDGLLVPLLTALDDLALDPNGVINPAHPEEVAAPEYAYNGVLRQRLANVYVDLATRAPRAGLYVLPYPQLVGGLEATTTCHLGSPLATRLGVLNLDVEERAEIASLIDQLNAVIGQAIGDANARLGGQRVHGVSPEVVEREFAGGQLCQGGTFNPSAAVNTIMLPAGVAGTLVSQTGPLTSSLHPNAAGQQALERALRHDLVADRVWLGSGQVVTLPGLTVPATAITLHVQATWTSGTVGLSLVAPDGRVVDAASPGVTGGGDATSAWLDVARPAAGLWTPRVQGLAVGAQGQEVRVTATFDEAGTPSPQAVVTVTRTAPTSRTATFDAAGSTASQGQLTYTWFFPDQQTAVGPSVTHTFPAGTPIWALVRLDDGLSIPTWQRVGLNTAPVAADDSVTLARGATLTVAAPGVLANDTDADGDPLTALLDRGASRGSVTLRPDGSYVYVPEAGFVGTDTFTYHVTDGLADSAPATVTLTVRASEPTASVGPTPTPTPTASVPGGLFGWLTGLLSSLFAQLLSLFTGWFTFWPRV